MRLSKQLKHYLHGYYNPKLINNLEEFLGSWSMGPHAKKGWLWFDMEYLTEEQIKRETKNKRRTKYVNEV